MTLFFETMLENEITLYCCISDEKKEYFLLKTHVFEL